MAKQILMWPNLEKDVYHYLKNAVPVPVFTSEGTEPPLTYVLIERAGGTSTSIDKDIDIEIRCVSTTRDGLWGAVTQIESAMSALETSAARETYIDEVKESFGFAFDESKNPDELRASATYTITVRPMVA